MNFAALTKEQKQYIALGAIGAVLLGYCLINFGLFPMLAHWRGIQDEYNELSSKLEDADRLIASEDTLRNHVKASADTLQAALWEHLPDTDNPLSWATQKIYFEAREHGIDVQSVTELVYNALV